MNTLEVLTLVLVVFAALAYIDKYHRYLKHNHQNSAMPL